jgi:hypothetical protein
MTDDAFSLLMQSLGASVLSKESDPRSVLAILMTETTRFRDKLLQETGVTLTVEDARVALDSLERVLEGQPMPDKLTSEQRILAQIYVDRLTTFRRR